MSAQVKFSKLRLQTSKRNKSATTSQISKFFSKAKSETKQATHVFESVPDPTPSNYLTDCPFKSGESSIQITSSLPERTLAKDLEHSDSKPLFSSLEAIKPFDLQRIEASKVGNRSTIKEFFPSQLNEKVFESPPQKLIKKATTFKKIKQRANSLKKQPKIKTSILKNEQILADYIVEQSIFDDVDPNELQMAIAMSKSQAKYCNKESGGDASNGSSNSMEALCEKLKEFEHQRRRRVEKNPIYGASKGRAKWANKFTSLTLRNPDRQQEIVNRKIQRLLGYQNFGIEGSTSNTGESLAISSGLLSNLRAVDSATHLRHSNCELNSIDEFYVTSIFEPAYTKIGNLLKDFRSIPGRSKSPLKICPYNDHISFSLLPKKENENSQNRDSLNNDLPKVEELKERNNVSPRIDGQDQIFFRETSPDLFLDEEDYESSRKQSNGNIINLSMQENACNPVVMKGQADIRDSLEDDANMDVVPISSESSSVEVLTCEHFPSKEVAIINKSGIWNQDLNYTLRNLHEHDENEIKDTENTIDLTQENIVDLTQEDFECHSESATDDQEHFLHLSQKSMPSNSVENLFEDSSSSIIVLSDDEVNYSIKIANGLNTPNEGDSEASGDELMSSFDKADAGTSMKIKECNLRKRADNSNSNEYENHLKRSKMDPKDKYVFNLLRSTPEPNRVKESELNYYLAHETMSHSFDEEFERISTEVETSDKMNIIKSDDDILCFDLTQITPPDYQYVDAPCSTNNLNNSIGRSSKKFRKTHSDSILVPKTTEPKIMKRHSSSKMFEESSSNKIQTNNFDNSEIDEFDRLVYGNLQDNKSLCGNADGISKLRTKDNHGEHDSIEEITVDEKVYLVKTQNVESKPDYEKMDSPVRLKELHKLGLKPLKRKQGIIMLEYVYNQTHPFVIHDDKQGDGHKEPENNDLINYSNKHLSDDESEELPRMSAILKRGNKYNLKDCLGSVLLDNDGASAETENEEYIFQTNIRIKMLTGLLPLHIAWFNLIKSNKLLREAILHYEPVDLQEIFIFFKSIGYRYDPRDLKRFFDGRSIIFQYDLNKEGSNRCIKKTHSNQGKQNERRPKPCTM